MSKSANGNRVDADAVRTALHKTVDGATNGVLTITGGGEIYLVADGARYDLPPGRYIVLSVAGKPAGDAAVGWIPLSIPGAADPPAVATAAGS